MSTVTIVDGRPKWQQKEDNFYACLVRCECFKKCYLRNYINCKYNGGEKYPRMENKQNDK